MDSIYSAIDDMQKQHSDMMDEIRRFKMSKMIEQRPNTLPSGLKNRMLNVISSKDPAHAIELKEYCEAAGYEFEFHQPQTDWTPKNNGDGSLSVSVNVNPADYKLVLKQTIA